MPDVKLTIIGQNLTKEAMSQLKRDLADTTTKLMATNKATSEMGERARKTREGMMYLAAGLGAVSAASLLAVRSGVQAAMQMQRMKFGLAAVAGSAQEANRQMEIFRQLAKMPGLGLPEVVKAATSLQALDFSLENATNVIREWGNELVRMGKGRAEMDHIVLALTQMVGKGKGFGQEIRQIAEVMPSIRKHMQTAFGTSASEEFEKSGITAQKFIAGITAELAKMPRVAGGAANSMENFTDALFNARVAMGEAFLPALTQILEVGTKVLEKYAEMPEMFRAMSSYSLLALGGITGLGAALASLHFIASKAKLAVFALSSALETMQIWLMYNPWAVIAAGAAVAVTALVLFYRHVQNAKRDVAALSESVDGLTESTAKTKHIKDLADRLKELQGKVTLTDDELKELKAIQLELIDISPTFISKFDKEGKATELSAERIKKYVEELENLNYAAKATEIRKAEDQIRQFTGDIEKAKEVQKLWNDRLTATNKSIEEEGRIAFITVEGIAQRIDLQDAAIIQSKAAEKAADDEATATTKLAKARANLDILLGKRVRKPLGPEEPPPSADMSKAVKDEELKLQDEIAQLQIARIEDETEKTIAAAKNQANAKIAEYRKALKAIDKDDRMAVLLRDAIAEQEKTRDFKVAEAQKKKTEGLAKIETERIQKVNDKRSEVAEKAAALSERQAADKARREAEGAARRQEEYEKEMAAVVDLNNSEESWQLLREKDAENTQKAMQEQAETERREAQETAAFLEKLRNDAIKAEEIKRREAQKTFDAYYIAEDMRISLIDDNTARELQLAKLRHETYVKNIEDELQDAEFLSERELELKRQLAYEEQLYAKEVEEIRHKARNDILRSTSDATAELPFQLARAIADSYGLSERYADDIKDLNRETQSEIDRINSDYSKSAAQRHRELEQMEKESAQKRLEIERKLDEERRAIYTDFVKNFFMQILSGLESKATDYLSDALFALLKTQLTKPESGGSTISSLVGTGVGLLSGNPAAGMAASTFLGNFGFDNPRNDAMAREFGKHAAALYGASFDNPINDFNAKLSGTKAAAYSLGRRSADDMLTNFTQGFVGSAREAGDGGSNAELTELLKDLKHTLQNPASFKLNIDGRELHSVIQRIDDRTRARGSGY